MSKKQICVWQATIVPKGGEKEFEQSLENTFGMKFEYVTQVKTEPTPDLPGTGGRNDTFFQLKDEMDVYRFALKRYVLGIQWFEDVVGNQPYIYAKSVTEKYYAWRDKEKEVVIEKSTDKPKCLLTGTDGNVFSIISKVARALVKAGKRKLADEFKSKALRQESYDHVLALCHDYVEVV